MYQIVFIDSLEDELIGPEVTELLVSPPADIEWLTRVWGEGTNTFNGPPPLFAFNLH